MSAASISTLSIQLLLQNNLQSEQTNLAQLNSQLATGVQYNNLTQYAPADAHNLMNFQNAITQRQGYISGMQNVSARLSVYDNTMTDMESMISQASTLAQQSTTLDTTKTASILSQANSYLQGMTDDLNQQVGGRYIYAGSRYNQPPVQDLANLTTTPTIPFTAVTSPALPDYDSSNIPNNSLTVNNAPPTGNFQVGSTAIKWSDLAAGSVTNVYVNGVATPVTVTGLTAASTPTELATNLQSAINQISTQVSDFNNLSANNTGAQVNLSYSGNPATITPAAGGTIGDISWADRNDGTTSETMATTDSAAYSQDSATIDTSYTVQYGVTSTATGFQQVIAGLQFMKAAAQSTDPTTYQTDMQQASSLLGNGLQAIQSLHAGVASSINTMTTETAAQNTDITNLQNQIGTIQQVDLTTVGTEINLLQTQLQASYSATASIEQLSIVKFL